MTYIRRKVFSILQDENGEERYFSTTEYELEEQKEFTSVRQAKKLAVTSRIQRNAVKAAHVTNQVEAEKALDAVKNNRLVKKIR